MKVFKLGILAVFFFSNALSAREYVAPFTPDAVIVADGFLQIRLPHELTLTECSNRTEIVLPDDHKYFQSYLAMSLVAFTAKKKLTVALESPCLTSNSWYQISIMSLHE
ncbi:MAG: hypothetical protein P8Y42_22265 [Exilibacterium sp.]